MYEVEVRFRISDLLSQTSFNNERKAFMTSFALNQRVTVTAFMHDKANGQIVSLEPTDRGIVRLINSFNQPIPDAIQVTETFTNSPTSRTYDIKLLTPQLGSKIQVIFQHPDDDSTLSGTSTAFDVVNGGGQPGIRELVTIVNPPTTL